MATTKLLETYRFFCEEDSQFFEEVRVDANVTCPVNPLHTIRLGSISIVLRNRQGMATFFAATNPTVDDDSQNHGVEVGDHWVNTSTLSAFTCLDATAASAVWKLIKLGSIGGGPGVVDGLLHWSWVDHGSGSVKSYIEVGDTDWVSVVASTFIGTDKWKPDTMEIVAEMKQSSGTGDVRIWDVTNNLEIVKATGISGIARLIYTETGLANLPAGKAQFEVQIKTSANGKKIRVYSVQLLRETP